MSAIIGQSIFPRAMASLSRKKHNTWSSRKAKERAWPQSNSPGIALQLSACQVCPSQPLLAYHIAPRSPADNRTVYPMAATTAGPLPPSHGQSGESAHGGPNGMPRKDLVWKYQAEIRPDSSCCSEADLIAQRRAARVAFEHALYRTISGKIIHWFGRQVESWTGTTSSEETESESQRDWYIHIKPRLHTRACTSPATFPGPRRRQAQEARPRSPGAQYTLLGRGPSQTSLSPLDLHSGSIQLNSRDPDLSGSRKLEDVSYGPRVYPQRRVWPPRSA